MKKYRVENTELDSVELKCLVVSRGLKEESIIKVKSYISEVLNER